MQPRLEEVAGTVAIGNYFFVERDGRRAATFIFGQVGLLQPEEIVVRKLLGEAALTARASG